jgi:hypothetical protein
MRIDGQELGQHYSSLTDEELLSMRRDDLTRTAQAIYDLEIAHRGLGETPEDEEEIEKSDKDLEGVNELLDSEYPEPEWLDNAVCVCSFDILPGNNSMERASLSQTVLQKAGIQSHLTLVRETSDDGSGSERTIVNVMVPIGLALHASSILERDLFNEEHETEWQTQLNVYSDKDLLALDPDIFCAGSLDRAARMKKVYAKEMAKRKLKGRSV